MTSRGVRLEIGNNEGFSVGARFVISTDMSEKDRPFRKMGARSQFPLEALPEDGTPSEVDVSKFRK